MQTSFACGPGRPGQEQKGEAKAAGRDVAEGASQVAADAKREAEAVALKLGVPVRSIRP